MKNTNEFEGMIQCPVCQKHLLPAGVALPEPYHKYLIPGEDEDDYDVDEESPVQYGWSVPVPFQVAVFRQFTLDLLDRVFPPLTLVCQRHPLQMIFTDEVLRFVPTIRMIQKEHLFLSAAAVKWIQEWLPQVGSEEGDDGTDQEKILWLWVQLNNHQFEQAQARQEADAETK